MVDGRTKKIILAPDHVTQNAHYHYTLEECSTFFEVTLEPENAFDDVDMTSVTLVGTFLG